MQKVDNRQLPSPPKPANRLRLTLTSLPVLGQNQLHRLNCVLQILCRPRLQMFMDVHRLSGRGGCTRFYSNCDVCPPCQISWSPKQACPAVLGVCGPAELDQASAQPTPRTAHHRTRPRVQCPWGTLSCCRWRCKGFWVRLPLKAPAGGCWKTHVSSPAHRLCTHSKNSCFAALYPTCYY